MWWCCLCLLIHPDHQYKQKQCDVRKCWLMKGYLVPISWQYESLLVVNRFPLHSLICCVILIIEAHLPVSSLVLLFSTSWFSKFFPWIHSIFFLLSWMFPPQNFLTVYIFFRLKQTQKNGNYLRDPFPMINDLMPNR